jgi:hypothetical protein
MRLVLITGLALLGFAAAPSHAAAQAAGVMQIAPSPET